MMVVPKLDNQEQVLALREKYDPLFYQIRPYIPLLEPFTPATLGELENISEYISQARRHLAPIALDFHKYVEADDRILCPVDRGRHDLVKLRLALHGCEALSLVDGGYEPRLVVARVPDPAQRAEALSEANRLGRSLGLVDALTLVVIEANSDIRLLASFPFGVGRVDYYDESLA